MALQDALDGFSTSIGNLGTAVKRIADVTKENKDRLAELTNVDNTSDLDKPVSTAQAAAIALKADASSVYTKAESDATKVEVLGTVSEAIANLVSAQGQIRSSTGDVFASIPTTATIMPFEVATVSSDVSVFDFDDANNTITFKRVGKYNFTSNVSIKSNVSAARTLTFTLVNTADSSVVSTETGTFNMASGTSQIIPMSTLLDVTTAPLTIQIKAQASDTGYVLHGFSSTLVSSVQVTLNVNTVEGLPAALLGKLDVGAKAADSDKLDGLDSTAFATAAQGTKADNALPKAGGTMTGPILSLREGSVAMSNGAIDCALGNHFAKTITAATTLTVTNVPASGSLYVLILELVNGGSSAVTWWSGIKWPGGTAPTLTTSGKDVYAFYTTDGGTVWNTLGKDVK